MAYMMAPLNMHSDDGFGAVAESFYRAAQILAKQGEQRQMFFNHLPEGFLLRHTIELFLKSGIVIVHRRLKLPYGSGTHSSEPEILVATGKWRSLQNTHNLPELYGYWKKLVVEHQTALEGLTEHGDYTIPAELEDAINALCAVDPLGDYFRYPMSKNRGADGQKSSFKEIDIAAMFPAEDDGKKVKALVVEDKDGNFVRAFKYDDETDKALLKASWIAAENLFGFHAMTRFGLMGGW